MIGIFILYFLIGLFATILGAVAGLGGGVIIKPVLDFFGHYDLATIGVLSAATVFSMSTVSLFKFKKMEVKIDKRNSAFIAGGSIVGGIAGKAIFNYIILQLNVSTGLGVFQSSLLAAILIIIYLFIKFRENITTYQINNGAVIFSVGVILGMLSAFLGIGGGPLNVAVLGFLFSMNAKDSTSNSIFIIFFSQLSALLLLAFTTGFEDYDLSMLGYMIVGGIIGGIVGTNLVRKLPVPAVEKVFLISILAILFINIYNIVSVLFLN